MAHSSDFRIIFQNEELLVVDKPFDVAMDGDRPELTVEKWVHETQQEFLARPLSEGHLTHHHGSCGTRAKQLKFVHQLDYATSGVLCLAFSRDMAARLAHCFEMRYTTKQYLAVLYGHIFDETDERFAASVNHASPSSSKRYAIIDAPIGVDEEDPEGFRMKVDTSKKGRGARTRLTVLQRGALATDPTIPVTKVLLQPESGRRHQLRVHTTLFGHPIVGDVTYASGWCQRHEGAQCTATDTAAQDTTVPALRPRMMLHAWRLQLGENINCTSQSHEERVAAKKKRRRETLKLEERDREPDVPVDPSSGASDGIEFVTEDPFTTYLVC